MAHFLERSDERVEVFRLWIIEKGRKLSTMLCDKLLQCGHHVFGRYVTEARQCRRIQ
jgi:hypothetical protein